MKEAVESVRLAEEEKKHQAATEQERQRLEQQKTHIPAPAPDIVPAKYPVWMKGGVAICALLVIALLVYWASSGSHSKKPAAETQKQEANTETPARATSTEPVPSEPQATPPGDHVKAQSLKPETSAQSTPTRPPVEAQSRALTPPMAAGGKAVAHAPQFTDPKLEDLYRRAQAGDSAAMVDLGLAQEEGNGVAKDYQQAVNWYRKAAEAGDVHGLYKLGVMYENGWGMTRDYQQAFNSYRKAAEAGDADAMANLGGMYYNGYGVENNYTQAVSWFRKAADARSATGMNYLGACYETGQGVNMDREQAVTWYRKAAQLGNEKAKKNLVRLGENP